MTAAKKKRGRPPKVIMSSGTAKLTYADLKTTRQQASDWMAIASLPQDVFDAALKDHSRKLTTRGLVNLARNLPLNHRRGDPLTEALWAAQKLSAADRHFLCVAILSADEAAQVVTAVRGHVEVAVVVSAGEQWPKFTGDNASWETVSEALHVIMAAGRDGDEFWAFVAALEEQFNYERPDKEQMADAAQKIFALAGPRARRVLHHRRVVAR